MRIIHFVDTYHNLTETFVNSFVIKSSEIAEILVVCFHKNNIFEDNNKINEAIFLQSCNRYYAFQRK
jgi:hypothetical protein